MIISSVILFVDSKIVKLHGREGPTVVMEVLFHVYAPLFGIRRLPLPVQLSTICSGGKFEMDRSCSI